MRVIMITVADGIGVADSVVVVESLMSRQKIRLV
jgi:hypothetical protein